MFIAPSTLKTHYQRDGGLESRINKVLSDTERFKQITKQTSPFVWHADFVLPNFAKIRNIEPSFDLETYFDIFIQNYPNSATFQVHLMGEDVDFQESLNYFQSHPLNPNWNYQILVRPQDFQLWQSVFSAHKNVQIGVWYDLGQWENIEIFDFNLVLLMTVVAGQSGQSITEETINNALIKLDKNQNIFFIFDGGWSVDRQFSYQNLSIVSDTAFWKIF